MPIVNEYEDATELLETYGRLHICLVKSETHVEDRFSIEIHYHWCAHKTLSSRSLSHLIFVCPGEAGAGKSCLLHHFTQNTCASCLVSSRRNLVMTVAVYLQSRNTPNIPSE